MVAGTLSRTLLGPAQGKRQRSTQISGTPARVFPCPLPTGAFRSNSTERQVGEVVSPGLGHWTLNPEGPESPPRKAPSHPGASLCSGRGLWLVSHLGPESSRSELLKSKALLLGTSQTTGCPCSPL